MIVRRLRIWLRVVLAMIAVLALLLTSSVAGAQGPRPSLLVPAGSIVTTSERVFVIRLKEGKAEWVNVERGNASGDLVEVLGPLHEGDLVVRRGSDELRPGTPLVPRGTVRAP